MTSVKIYENERIKKIKHKGKQKYLLGCGHSRHRQVLFFASLSCRSSSSSCSGRWQLSSRSIFPSLLRPLFIYIFFLEQRKLMGGWLIFRNQCFLLGEKLYGRRGAGELWQVLDATAFYSLQPKVSRPFRAQWRLAARACMFLYEQTWKLQVIVIRELENF